MTADLIAFLRDCLNDDERALKEITTSDVPDEIWWKPADDRGPACLSLALVGPKRFWRAWAPGWDDEVLEWGWVVADTARQVFSQDVVRERLADIDAKRQLIAWVQQLWRNAADCDFFGVDQDEFLVMLAQPYRDRPGFRPEWAIEAAP